MIDRQISFEKVRASSRSDCRYGDHSVWFVVIVSSSARKVKYQKLKDVTVGLIFNPTAALAGLFIRGVSHAGPLRLNKHYPMRNSAVAGGAIFGSKAGGGVSQPEG